MADGDLRMLGWQVTLGQVQVGTTDSAAADPDADLADAGLRLRAVGTAQRPLVDGCAPLYYPGSHVTSG